MNDEKTYDDGLLEEAVRQFQEMPLDESHLTGSLARTRQALLQAIPEDYTRKDIKNDGQPFWRIIIMNKWAQLITAAAMVVIIAVAGTFLLSSTKTAYAWEQTVEAFKSVRFVHIVRGPFKVGELSVEGDERWIEIGPDGFQARYRQDSSPFLLVVDDRKTVFAHFKDKGTVILYDAKDKSFQWIGNLDQFFADLAGEPGSVTIEENVDYKGRRAHRVRLLEQNQDVYIDPDTKLPIHKQGYDISYEDPPEGTFDIPAIPEGVTLVDKRSGAEQAEEPVWIKENADADHLFTQARQALAKGKYEEAAELFTKVVEIQKMRNWAWYWLGRAHYAMGDDQAAIQAFSQVIEMFRDVGAAPYYCYLARGLAYRHAGMEDEAKRDFGKTLGVMIQALRHIEGTKMFDYANDPLYHDMPSNERPSDEKRFVAMIARLQEVTGQSFGYNPEMTVEQQEAVISAWERWWQNNAAEYGAVTVE